MELFAKIDNGSYALHIFPKRSVLEVWQGLECTSSHEILFSYVFSPVIITNSVF